MAFRKQVPTLDLETTAFENIFLTEFLPMADGPGLKVYLLGYRYACDSESHSRFSNEALARHLNLSLKEVVDAWSFWEERGLVKKVDINPNHPSEFTVEFVSVRQLYIENNFSPKQYDASPKPVSKPKKAGPENLTDSLKEPFLKRMFREIEALMGRPLEPNDCLEILEWLDSMALEPGTIVKAFEFVVKEKNIRNIKYTGSVLRSWSDNGQKSASDPPQQKKSKPPAKITKPNRFHNFEGRYSKMSDEELEALIKNRKSVWGKDDSQ